MTFRPLNPRLAAIAAAVLPDLPMADIGTDHGLLPIYLALSGSVPRAFACDKREQPLKQTRLNVASARVATVVETRLGDGFRPVQHESLGTVTIAGMGSAAIRDILRGRRDCEVRRLVLAPNDDAVLLRETLFELELELDDERIVVDDGRFYPILVASAPAPNTSSPPCSHTRADLLLGAPLHHGGPNVRAWLQARATHLATHLGATAGRRSGPDAAQALEDLDILRAFLFRAERSQNFS